jgi:hypothetical protein
MMADVAEGEPWLKSKSIGLSARLYCVCSVRKSEKNIGNHGGVWSACTEPDAR